MVWTRVIMVFSGLAVLLSGLLSVIGVGGTQVAHAAGGMPGELLMYSAWTSLEALNADLYMGDLTRGLTVTLARDTQAHFNLAPDGQRVVYTAYHDRYPQTFLLHLATGRRQRLTPDHDFNDRLPTFSPDGSQIAFFRNLSPTTRNALYPHLMDADGGRQRLVSELLVTFADAQWSPDGTHLAMQVQHDDYNSKIHVLNVETGRSRLLSPTPGLERLPRWSPDGGQLIFVRSYGGEHALVLVDMTAGAERVLLRRQIIDALAWSPDGGQIALIALSAPDQMQQVYVFSVAEGTLRPLTAAHRRHKQVAWSPDGHWLAFITEERPGGAGDIYLVDAANGQTHRVLRQRGLLGMFAWR